MIISVIVLVTSNERTVGTTENANWKELIMLGVMISSLKTMFFVFIQQKKPVAYHLIVMHISLAYIKPRLISNEVNGVNGKWTLKIVEERNCVYIARFPIRD